MHTPSRLCSTATLFVMMLASIMLAFLSGPALAQRQGGGKNPAGTPLIFEHIASVKGKTPNWSGDFTTGAHTMYYGNRVTNLSFSIRGKTLLFPDNTRQIAV